MASPATPPRPGTQFKTPGGAPLIELQISQIFKDDSGVSSGGLRTAVHPEASIGPSFIVKRTAGKFQGEMRPQTPMGCLVV